MKIVIHVLLFSMISSNILGQAQPKKKGGKIEIIDNIKLPQVNNNDDKEENDGPENRTHRHDHLAKMIMPVNSKTFPTETYINGHESVDKELKNSRNARPNVGIGNVTWSEQGPENIGGRTRTIMFDLNNSNKVWAGASSGGLWYNNNIHDVNSSWVKVNDFWANLDITAIAAHPNQPNTIYVGTGERLPGDGIIINGGGIWKSTDGGVTWSQLNSTKPSVEFSFRFIQKIVVASTGRVYAATENGVRFSDDGGLTWNVIGGNNLNTNFIYDLEIDASNTIYFTSSNGFPGGSGIYSYPGTGTNIFIITPGNTPINRGRIEIALAPSTSGSNTVIYAICIKNTIEANATTDVLWFKRTNDKGQTWYDKAIPTHNYNNQTLVFTSNSSGFQGNYDLILAVHPTNANLVLLGGAVVTRSTDGGVNWGYSPYNYLVHADIHAFAFDNANNNRVLIGNDGGIGYSPNYGDATANPSFEKRNKGYRVTEYYRVAIKNIADDHYTIAGAQDNGTSKMTNQFFSDGEIIYGGDGMNCFIDKDNPLIQIVSQQNIKHSLYSETFNFTTPLLVVPSLNGGFVNPCDYSSPHNIFYAFGNAVDSTTSSVFYMVRDVGSSNPITTRINLGEYYPASFIRATSVARVFLVGTGDGQLVKIDLSNLSAPTYEDLTPINSINNAGNVSWIELRNNDNEILMVQSNYNVNSLLMSVDGGYGWSVINENGLPSGIPIFCAKFHPDNPNKWLVIGTEMGVYTTMNYTASNPEWEAATAGLAHVRCMAFDYRTVDNTLAVATHGRGVFKAKLGTCPLNRNLGFWELPTGQGHYEAGAQITSDTTLPEGLIRFDAGSNVKLTSGFKVKAGTQFKAYIDGCGGTR